MWGILSAYWPHILAVISIVMAVVAAAHAVETGRRPRARDLAALGIEPKAFDKIGRYY